MTTGHNQDDDHDDDKYDDDTDVMMHHTHSRNTASNEQPSLLRPLFSNLTIATKTSVWGDVEAETTPEGKGCRRWLVTHAAAVRVGYNIFTLIRIQASKQAKQNFTAKA